MYGRRYNFAKIIFVAVLVGLMPGLLQVSQMTPSFAEETGSVKVVVNHSDGSTANPEDFYASSDQEEREGYFSLEEKDGGIVDIFPTCNESEASCEIDGLAAGDYSAAISLGGSSITVGGDPEEYAEDLTVESGIVTEVTITVDYGFAEIDVMHSDGQGINSDEFVSEYGLVEGYYSLYNDNGDFVADAPSCNSSASCTVVLPGGIYTATVASPASLELYSVVFEVVDNTLSRENIEVEIGSFKVTVLDQNDEVADSSSFSHPIGYSEAGWFAAYDADGFLIMDGETCNISDPCTYPYDAGIYKISIRRFPSNLILSCFFEITDNNLTPVQLYLDSRGCNQTPVDPSTGSGDNNVPPGGNGNNDPGVGPNPSGGTNSGTAAGLNPSLTNSLLQRRTVSIIDHTHYIDYDGSFHLVGEVMNTQTIPARNVVVTGVFYDNATKDVLAIKRGHTSLDFLKPGDKSPFEIVIQDLGAAKKIGYYVLNAIFSNTTLSTLKPELLGANITHNGYSNDTGLYHVYGRVFNYGDSDAHFVKVIVSVYDQQNKIIYVVQKYISSRLVTSSSSDFAVVFAPTNASNIAHVSAIVQSDEYTMIPGGKLLESPIVLVLDATSYDNGDIMRINGTVGKVVPWEKYAIIYILWPNNNNYDKELVRVTDEGSYDENIHFLTINELRGDTFTVRVVYNNNFAEKSFTFT